MRNTLPLLGLAFLLTGCGADKPVAQMPPAFAPPPPAAVASADAVPASAAAPLTGSAPDSTAPTSDPLIGNAGDPAKDPLAGGDPFSGQDPSAGDGILLMNGQKMPTRNTHWLRGRVREAKVGVLLNGIRLGEFSDLVDRDITPRLHVGINTVTFIYQPLSAQSFVRLDLLEGEHHPPLPPLATFQNDPFSSSTSPSPAMLPQTKMMTFTAR